MLTGNYIFQNKTGWKKSDTKGVHEMAKISCVRNLSIGHKEKSKK